MTEIRSITGITGIVSEMKDRGKYVSKSAPYIPYTAMTKGEFELALLEDVTRVKAALFPEVKAYKSAADMYANALNAGISKGVNFIGALYDPILQQAALNVAKASKMTKPAAGSFIGRVALDTGVKIGDPTTYSGSFDHDCVQYATKLANTKFNMNRSWTWWNNTTNLTGPDKTKREFWNAKKNECEIKVGIEKIMNRYMVKTSHQILYKNISSGFTPILGSQVLTKKILHGSAVGGLANVAGLEYKTLDSWAESCVIRTNASIGVGDVSSVDSSMAFSPDPEKYLTEYNKFIQKNPGQAPVFEKIAGFPSIGCEAICLAIIAGAGSIITAALQQNGETKRFKLELESKQSGALATVQGYGTPGFGPDQNDFLTPSTNTGDSSNLLLLGGAALLGYALLK